MTQEIYSLNDQVAPYLHYHCNCRLAIAAGGVQMPLAYKTPPTIGKNANPTSRLFQAAEPTCWYAVEWVGVRQGEKPEPPKFGPLGSFILHSVVAEVRGVFKGANGQDVIAAAGYYLFSTVTRPEYCTVPAFWAPWDYRYNDSGGQGYGYTIEDLGITALIPGLAVQTEGNPVVINQVDPGNKLGGVNP